MNFDEISFRIRYAETDQMGVVYHGNYAQYLEVGRVEWLRKLGVSYKTMEENGVMLPVVSLQMQFKKPALYDDFITVRTMLKKTPTAKIEFGFEIYNESREVLATADVILVFVNMKTKRPMSCPKYLLEKIAKVY